MTLDTYNNLSQYIGSRNLPNSLWVDLISESFGVSRSIASEMLHSMMVARSMKIEYSGVTKNYCRIKGAGCELATRDGYCAVTVCKM